MVNQGCSRAAHAEMRLAARRGSKQHNLAARCLWPQQPLTSNELQRLVATKDNVLGFHARSRDSKSQPSSPALCQQPHQINTFKVLGFPLGSNEHDRAALLKCGVASVRDAEAIKNALVLVFNYPLELKGTMRCALQQQIPRTPRRPQTASASSAQADKLRPGVRRRLRAQLR